MVWNDWRISGATSAGRGAGAVSESDDEGIRRVGPLTIWPQRHEVRVAGEAVLLTAMELSILMLLATRPGQVFSPEQIAEACHDGHTPVQPKSVNRRVQALRQKLGDAGQLITNLRGVGYCLVSTAASDEQGSGGRWFTLAPLLAWWGERGMRGKLGAGAVALSATGLLGLGGWLARDAVLPTPGTQGMTLAAAGVWRPVEAVEGGDPIAYLERVAAWSGAGSSIVYTGQGDEYLILSDRGYESGKDDPVCRWHRVRLEATPADRADGPAELHITWLSQTLLQDESGQPLRGGSRDLQRRYDPEAMCLDAAGNVWIAEEYGPSIDLFSPDGRRIRRLPIPEHLRVARPHHDPDKERRDNILGRTPNRGFEALALDEERGVLWAMTQAPLIQDGSEGGESVRLLALSVEDGRLVDEWVYPLEAEEHQVSEMLLRDGALWVLERDLRAGPEARFKRVFAVRTDGATPVTGIASLPSNRLPADIVPVDKRLVVDVLALARRAEPLGLAVYEQFEGMTLGPTGPAGQPRLLITTDNGRSGVYMGEVMSAYEIELKESSASPWEDTLASAPSINLKPEVEN